MPDSQWITVTMDNGLSFVVGGGWSLPPGYPNFSTTWIEMIGTEGALLVDDSHRDVVLNTMKDGMRLPMSSMPGEFVEHTYAGPMAARDRAFPRSGRLRPAGAGDRRSRRAQVMEVYIAADLSAERNEPVDLPLPESRGEARGGLKDMPKKKPKRIGLAIVGAGRVGLIRGELAARHPAGRLDRHRREEPGARRRSCAEKIGADFVTARFPRAARAARSQCGRSSPPTSTCTSIRSWRRSSASCRC